MSGRIFILIETENGRSKEVYANLKRLGGLRTVDLVTQPYDIIVVADGQTPRDGSRLDGMIQPIGGVVRTVVLSAA